MLTHPRGFGRLAPWKTKKAEPYVRTLSLDVGLEATGRLGDVQGLLSTVTDARTGDILSANIEEAFSVGVGDALARMTVNATLEQAFESAISRVNLRLSRLLGERGLPLDSGSVHGAIVAQKGREVAVATWGRPSLLLFRQGVQGGPRFFDVLEDDERQKSDKGNGFTNLISGKISGKDRMIISNRNVTELLTERAVREILSAPKTETATMLLRDALLARHEDLSLALLLLDGAPVMEAPQAALPSSEKRPIVASGPIPLMRPTAPRNDAVIDKGVDVSSTTRQRDNATAAEGGMKMASSVVRNVKGGSADLVKMLGRTAQGTGGLLAKAVAATKERLSAVRAAQQDAPVEPEPSFVPAPSMTDASPVEAMGPVLITPQPDIPQPKPKKLPFPDRAVDVWNGLTPKSRYLLIAAMVLVFLLNVSLGALGWQRGRENAIADYEKGVAAIRQQIDSAEASMIYRDEDRARRLLEESAAAIAALREDTEERTVAKRELETAIAAKFAELRRVVPLNNPEVLAAVATQTGTPNLSRLAYDGTSYWSASADGSVFKISAADGSAQLLYAPEGKGAPDVFIATRNGALIGDESGLALVTTGGNALPMTLPLGDLEVDIGDATVFGSRLYFLDSAHNRILRFGAIEGGYGTHAFYVKDATDLSGGVSLAIDGYVYVLKADGSVVRLLRGEKTEFSAGTVEPAMTSAAVLRTPSDTDDLYVLDGTAPRVVRFDKKSGSLIAQYQADALAGATDFWVDQGARTIVAVNGNRLLRFTWPAEE